jgi:hypothetical protein
MTKPGTGAGTPPISGRNIVGRPSNVLPLRTPRALEMALRDLTMGEKFLDAVNRAAENAGCSMLFEIPAILLGGKGDRAAAIACGPTQDLMFIVFDSESGTISVISADEVPETVLDFTRSYAGVLGMIANDRTVIAPLLQ